MGEFDLTSARRPGKTARRRFHRPSGNALLGRGASGVSGILAQLSHSTAPIELQPPAELSFMARGSSFSPPKSNSSCSFAAEDIMHGADRQGDQMFVFDREAPWGRIMGSVMGKTSWEKHRANGDHGPSGIGV